MINGRSVSGCLVLLALASLTASAADNWEKMRDCAGAADKLHKEWTSYDPKITDFSPKFHYSPKYNKCYLLESRNVKLSENGRFRFLMDLTDVFERDSVAIVVKEYREAGKEPEPGLCMVEGYGSRERCPLAEAYIADHMNN
jgi:hypothetical protein